MKNFLRALFVATLLPVATHAAIETWTNAEGQTMQAEFINREGDSLSFKKPDGTRYVYSYAKLAAADRTRIDAHTLKLPAAPTQLTVQAVAATPGKALAGLSSKLVVLKSTNLVPYPSEALGDIKYVAFYYSASWCPPCQKFTPKLVEAYKKIKAAHPEFELIFVSSDEDEKAMKDYMKEDKMPWPAVRFSQIKSTPSIRRPRNESGIPNLVFMDADGKELSLSYTASGEYSGPSQVIRDIEKQLKP
jgi:nucleoredoxin